MWDMTVQMNVPGMPAGMMQPRTQQVCQSKDFRSAHQSDGKSRCTITNLKETPARVTYDIRCEGKEPMTGKAEFNFQNGRQKVDGTMQLSTGDGDMTMKMSGRNLGSACDPQQTKVAQDPKTTAAMQQMESLQRQGDAAQIAGCNEGLAKMQPLGFGTAGQCRIYQDANCKALERTSPAVKSACNEKIGQFCQRYQTRDGLEKITASHGGSAEQAAKLCAVPLQKVRASLCPAAVKDNALVFVAHNCPAEAKVIAQKQCAGRSFTSMDEKYGQFCGAYRGKVASGDDEEDRPTAAARQRSAAKPQPASEAAKSAAPS